MKKDSAGNDVPPPSYDYVAGFNVSYLSLSSGFGLSAILIIQTQPKPFAFDLRAREGRKDLVNREYGSHWNS
jgi:hypothetical protein